MATKRRIRKTNDGGDSNNVKDMPFSVTDGEKAAILESIPEPMVLLDTDLKIVWSNDAMNKLVNLNADQLAGQHCYEKIHGLKSPCSDCPVVKTINTGQPCTVNDLSSLCKKWTLHAYPLRDEKGNITRVVGIVTDTTESKHAEKRGNRVRKLQSMILDNSTVGIAFIRNRIYEWVNPRLCEIYGIPKEQLEGSHTHKIYPDDESYQKQGDEIYSLLARGGKASVEANMRKGDGTLFWCQLEGKALDASKPDEGSIWIVEDITKRRQAEEEIRKLNKLQSVILDNSAVGIAYVRNRTFEWVNSKMSELFGIPMERLQGSSTRIVYPDDDIFNRLGFEAYSLFTQGKKVTFDTQLRKGDGSLFWCRYKGIILDPSNTQDGSIWIAEDITERKMAEEALRKSEEKFRSLVEGLNEALFRMTLPDEIFEYFSPSVTNVLGYSAEGFIADPLLMRRAIHPDFQDYINKIFKELKEGIVSPNYEYKIIDAKGKERWIIQSNKGIFDKNGKLIALEGLCRDISGSKRAEEALERRIVALTKPLDDIESISFEDLFNLSDLQHLQDMLAESWGVAVLLTRPDGTLVTQPSNFTYFCSEFIRKSEKGCRNCQKSDTVLGNYNPSGPIIQKCLSAGLWGGGASITIGGRHIASWLIGQVRNEAQSEEEIIKYAREIGADEAAFREAFFQVPVMPQEKFEQIAHTLFALANQLSNVAYQNIQQARFIAERKLAEEALRNSEEKFRGIYEVSPIGIELYDREGTLLEANRICFDIFGICDVMALKGFNLFRDPNLAEECKEQLRRGESVRLEMPYDFGKVTALNLYETTKKGIIYLDVLFTPLKGSKKESDIGYLVHVRDITDRKQAEEALLESEKQVRRKLDAILSPEGDISTLELSDIIDTEKTQKLMDEFFDLTNLPMTIVDLKGKVLVGIGWQDICTNFHRVNPESCRLCKESDIELTSNVPVGTFKKYRCKNNMWDIATPIMLSDKCVGNIFMGQFLFDNEKPDYETFRQQARKYGFDEQEYIAALDRVPHWSEKTINKAMSFFTIFAGIIGNLGYSNIKLANALEERKRAEDRLRVSEEKFRSIYEESPMGIELYDWDGSLLDVNRACLDIFGISDAETLIELNLFDNPNLAEECKEQLRRGESVRLEMPYDFGKVTAFNLYETTKSGIIYLDVLITPLRGAQKESDIGYLVHTRDISKRKQAEYALRESEAKYRRLHESITEAFASVDMNGRIMESNRPYQTMLGYSEEELRHLKYSNITPRKWRTLEKRIVEEQILVHGYSNVYEKEYQRKDGSIFPVELSTFLIRDDAGNPVGMWAIVHDITERKKMETELNAAKDYLRTVFNNVNDAIFVHDLSGTIVDVNDKMLEMYRISRQEVIGSNVIRDFSATDETIEVSRANWNMVISGENYFAPWKAKRPKDGSVFDVEVFLTRLALPDGNYILANVRDITERKQMEEEQRKIEARMQEVQKLESLGVLAGGIAHDFNNLLMAILGRADLALFSLSETSPAYQHVEEITRASHRAADLCRQMLAYSGKGRFVIGRYNISDIVREMGQILNVSISKNAMMRYSLAEKLPAVEADATQIRQVVMNLITNASDALSDGQGIISVKTGVMECDETYLSSSYLDDKLPGGTYVYIEVSDSGCGMDSKTLSRIFDPFFSKKFTGRGLGLAAVLGIVRGHKGAIKVYSEAGKGTTFKILLPAVEWKPNDKVKTESQPSLLNGEGTILVVDDDPLVRDVASDMLIQLGFQVLTASNGREGLEVFKTHGNEVICIILDLTMPEMGGEEAFLELRKLKKDVKVILSSGYNEQDVTQRFVGKGLAGFIQKPYTLAGLRSALNRALG